MGEIKTKYRGICLLRIFGGYSQNCMKFHPYKQMNNCSFFIDYCTSNCEPGAHTVFFLGGGGEGGCLLGYIEFRFEF
jgi:hypothetical protein